MVSLGVWSNHFDSTFQEDDSHVIVKNRAIQDLANIPHFFRNPLLFADRPEYAQYRPVALVSLALDYQVANPVNPRVFDIDSFAWFLVEVVLFFVLCTYIPGNNWRWSLFAVALFAFHPVTGETLNYSSHRGDIIGACGLLAGLAWWIILPRHLPREIMPWHGGVPKTDWDDFRRRWSPRVNARYRRFVEAPLGFYMIPVVFGLLADPDVAVFPLLLLAYILLLEKGPRTTATWRRVLPSAVLCLVFWIGQLVSTWSYGVGFRLPLFSYWVTQPWVTVRYLWTFLVPVHLTAGSDLAVFNNFLSPVAYVGFAGLVLIVIGAWQLGKHRQWKPVAFGIWWFLITLVPTILVPQRVAESDTRMYLALLGLSIAGAAAASVTYARFASRPANRLTADVIAAFSVFLLLVGYSVLTYERSEIWKSTVDFQEDITRKSPRNGRAFIELANALNVEGQTDRAGEALQHAAVLVAAGQSDAPDELLLARAFDQMNRDREAETHFKLALKADASYSMAWSAYSQWLIARRRDPEAYQAAQKAAKLGPWNMEAQHTLLQYYLDRSEWANLRKVSAAVLRTDPTDADAKRSATVAQAAFDAVKTAEQRVKEAPSVNQYLALSVHYYHTSRYQDSIRACQEALKLDPGAAEAYSNMAAAEYALGRIDEAMKSLRETLRLRPDIDVARRNLDFLMAVKSGARKADPPAESVP